MTGKATPDETKEFHERQAGVIDRILTIPFGELFIEKEARSEIPERARISGSVQCAVCGEMVAVAPGPHQKRKNCCIPCAGDTQGLVTLFYPVFPMGAGRFWWIYLITGTSNSILTVTPYGRN